jgi:hypothetical protein
MRVSFFEVVVAAVVRLKKDPPDQRVARWLI